MKSEPGYRESTATNFSPTFFRATQRKGAHDVQAEKRARRKPDATASFFNPAITPQLHRDGPPDIQKDDKQKPSTPCPDSVTIGGLAQFNHSKLSADDKEKWGTYLGVTSQMKVGPGPDHSGHCMKEALITIKNDCPESVYNREGKTTEPCTGNKCLDINRYGSSGDAPTGSSLSDGPDSFIDLHRTRFTGSLLEGTGKTSCSVVCEQTYSCDRKKATTGKFIITRNFQAGTHTKKDKSSMHITTGTVKKELKK